MRYSSPKDRARETLRAIDEVLGELVDGPDHDRLLRWTVFHTLVSDLSALAVQQRIGDEVLRTRLAGLAEVGRALAGLASAAPSAREVAAENRSDFAKMAQNHLADIRGPQGFDVGPL